MNAHPYETQYSRSLTSAAIQSGIVALAAGVLVDGGRTLAATVAALISFWMVAIAIWLRHGEVQRHEVVFARYGILTILFTAVTAVFIQGLFG